MANPLYDRLFGRHASANTPFLYLPSGNTLTHKAFVAMAARMAQVFAEAGLKPGDRVAAQVDKSTYALAVYAACVQSGVVFLPLNPAYTETELAYFFEDSGAALILCPTTRATGIAPMADRLGAALLTLDADGSGTLMERAEAQSGIFETVDRVEGDLAALLYTSGTTGRSKGAMLTQGNLLSNAEVLVEAWQFTKKDVLLHALPIFHTHGLFVAANVTLLAGGAMIFLPRFDVDALIAWMPKATTLMGVPTFYTRLLDEDRFTKGHTDQMRLFISGSAPLLAETHAAFEELTGHKILERYGMTETNMNTSNPYDGERRAGTVGLPLPGVEVIVTDPESGAPLPMGEIGVIEVRGPNVFEGYWQMPEKTAAELRENGFFITGDLGLIDDDGYVQIVGRQKDLIISGGYNIYPKEVELVLDAQPGVLESAVIGVPDSDLGEVVMGVVVARPGARPDVSAIVEGAGRALAAYKVPRRIVLVEALPRNTMGKVQKNLLRDRYAKG